MDLQPAPRIACWRGMGTNDRYIAKNLKCYVIRAGTEALNPRSSFDSHGRTYSDSEQQTPSTSVQWRRGTRSPYSSHLINPKIFHVNCNTGTVYLEGPVHEAVALDSFGKRFLGAMAQGVLTLVATKKKMAFRVPWFKGGWICSEVKMWPGTCGLSLGLRKPTREVMVKCKRLT